MKKFFLILPILISGCGFGNVLPMAVYVESPELASDVTEAVDFYNNKFDDVFVLTNNPASADIMIKCTTVADLNRKEYIGWSYSGGTIKIACDYSLAPLLNIVAHELWHQLGFGHSDNQDCLNYSQVRTGALDDLICPEMVQGFNEMYGDRKDEN